MIELFHTALAPPPNDVRIPACPKCGKSGRFVGITHKFSNDRYRFRCDCGFKTRWVDTFTEACYAARELT